MQGRGVRRSESHPRAARGAEAVADYAAGGRLVFLKNDHQGREVTNLGRAKGQAVGVKRSSGVNESRFVDNASPFISLAAIDGCSGFVGVAACQPRTGIMN